MLAGLLLQLIGWAVLIGTFLALIDRLGVFSRPMRFHEETMTRLWRKSAGAAGDAAQDEARRRTLGGSGTGRS